MINKLKLTLYEKLYFFEQCGYVPHPKQLLFHEACLNHRFVAMAAGARGGKSMAAGAEIAFYLVFCPGIQIWCVSITYNLAEKEFFWAIKFLEKYRFPGGRFKGDRFIEHCNLSLPRKGSKSIRTPWFGLCETVSTKEPANLLGESIDLHVLGEASQIPYEPWDRSLRARLGDRNGKAIAVSTPNTNKGLFVDFYKRGQSESTDFSEWWSIKYSVIENPVFSRKEYESAKKELDPKVFAEQYDGDFISRKGRVFEAFCKEHIFSEYPDGFEHWGVFVSIYHHDNSYNTPFTALFCAINPKDKSVWVYDEIYVAQSQQEEQFIAILEKGSGKRILGHMVPFFNKKLINDAESFLHKGKELVNVTTPEEEEISKKDATIKRIQALQSWLKLDDDGMARVNIHESCKNTIKELEDCSWREEMPEEREKAEPSLPLDKFINCPTAISQIVSYLSLGLGYDIYKYQFSKASSEKNTALDQAS